MATVLYVDDEDPIRRAVSLWLARKGHTVHTAADAAAARELLDAHAGVLDGVFIDVWLGIESGVELYHWLAARHPALVGRVAFVTGDLFDRGIDGIPGARVFTKPFALQALEEQVARWGERDAVSDGGGAGGA